MSLLNRMLQDLDARQEGGRAAARLHDDVRPLPPAVASRWPKRVATLVVAGAIVVGVAYDAEGRVNEAREALLRAKASGTLSAELLAVAEQKLR